MLNLNVVILNELTTISASFIIVQNVLMKVVFRSAVG